MEPRVRAGVLTHYFDVAREYGLNPGPQLRAAGLTLAMIADPDSRIPLASAITLLEQSAEAANCPSLALRMTERRLMADFGPVGLLLQHQANLRDALSVLQRYEHLLNESLAIHVSEGDGVVVVREEVVSAFAGGARQSIELAMGVLFGMCSEILGPQWRPLEVHFVHDEPTELDVHRRMFRCRLCFGGEFNGLVLLAEDLDRRNPQANEAMARYARRYLDSMPDGRGAGIEQRVRNALYVLLPLGRASLAQVAEHIGLTARTLQRRLDDAGATYSDQLEEVRAELADRYLRNHGYPLSQIADLLGYASPSAFTRWFKGRWGATPSAVRQRGPTGTAD